MLKKFLILVIVSVASLMASDSIVIPHVATDTASFKTNLILENRTDVTMTFSMFGYDANGQSATATKTLEPSARVTYAMEEVFPDKTVTHIFIQKNDGLFAGVEYIPLINPDNRTFVEGIRDFTHRWRVYPSNWKSTFDGLVVVGTSCYPYALTVTQYQMNGTPIRSLPIAEDSLFGFGKLVFNLGNVFEDIEGSYVEVSSNYPLVAMGLKGTLHEDSGIGWLVGNQAEPYPAFESLQAELAANRALWQNSSLNSDYQMNQTRSCFCPVNTAIMDVANGELTSIQYDDGSDVNLADSRNFHTVPELFDLISGAIAQGYDNLAVTFNRDHGYPENIYLDPIGCATDDELNYIMTVAPR